MKKLIAILACLSVFSGACASLQSVSMTQVPTDRSHPIEANSSSWGLFGIFFTNSFADDAVKELQGKCPNGRITGVFTKQESRFYLLVLERKVLATAFCESAPKSGKNI